MGAWATSHTRTASTLTSSIPVATGWRLPPDLPAQIDRASAQELVDRFVAAGAQHVFVGRGLGLRGPRGVVVPIAYHLDHMHVRLAPEHPARAPRPCPWKPL